MAGLDLDDDTVIPRSAMEGQAAVKVVCVFTPVDHGFIVDFEVIILNNLYIHSSC